ncbi:MAG: 2-hydroxychromene-2-carboxylate isomerase [Rhodospirillales bacterium]|nr:2-hydroxychromene-2-carboxylate isomerase [Rhodospirillales bacterium]
MTKSIDFWYEFASTYSYLSVMRIEGEAAKRGVSVNWKPFLLGPIFHSQGWDNSPFNIYPAKGRYMWRDMVRRCRRIGLPFKVPEVFPVHSVKAARVAWVGANEGWGAAYSQRVFTAQFAEGRNIADREVLKEILEELKLESDRIMALIEESPVKDGLRKQTEEATSLGIFGAPSFMVGDELFWGDDRLEEALEWG